MDHTIKHTVTITITETWTIVWTTDSAPNRTAEAQTVQPTAHSNAIPDSLVEEQGAERCASPLPANRSTTGRSTGSPNGQEPAQAEPRSRHPRSAKSTAR